MLWPKYDKELSSSLNGMDLIRSFIAHCFEEAGLAVDFTAMMSKFNIQGLIIEEVNQKPDFRDDYSGPERPIQLSQAQILSIFKRVYGLEDIKQPIKAAKSVSTVNYISQISKSQIGGNYADFYKKVQEMAKDKGWSDEKFRDTLKDRALAEKEYRQVSRRILD
jgi:hypothetical protein